MTAQKTKNAEKQIEQVFLKGKETSELVREFVKSGFSGLNKAILACEKCPLHKTASNKVIGKGSKSPKVLFIGEAPGKNEDAKGIPFCGRAGKELDKMLKEMALSAEDWAVINTIKCRPPENRTPYKTELESCKPFLLAQIELFDPKVIVLLGNTAERAFFQGRSLEWGISKRFEDRTVLKLYHPAALIYTRSRVELQKKMIEMNRKLWE
ncbi:MAG: uracil-DNA glycosylase [Methanosarcinaceae archaeon]|nr:uracil-DNA glycosylase [Methanosarcinaceae archaeon]MDD4331028.1 uracil-DNA glycosylase [Methanosarcinaceae archaeon]MDD4748945.1 uracil-DNA glycosylase [Methanosarcinaceae archaeon]